MRKGQIASSIDWSIALICTFFVFFMLVFLTNGFRPEPIDTADIDPYIYLAKLHHGGLLYEINPHTQQINLGVIDLQKFSSAHLDKYNDYPEGYVGVRLELLNEDMTPVAGVPNPIFNNKRLYTDYEGFARLGVQKAGGASFSNFLLPVTYDDNGIPRRAYLDIKIVRPNS